MANDEPEEQPVQEEPVAAAPQEAATTEPETPEPAAPSTGTAPEAVASAAEPQTETPAPQAETPQDVAQVAPPASPVSTPQDMSNDLKVEDQAFANDLTNGHIKPKTYKDLMGQGVLGKIGTLFGLMVSGAGSGLAKQPNLLMEMMNREISNDLEAQKQSKTNAQNLYRLNLEHQMNQAQMKKMGYENAFTQSQTEAVKAKTPAEVERLKAETSMTKAHEKALLTEAATKADALSQVQANRIALHSLVSMVEKYPVGSPERQRADQVLAVLSTQVDAHNANLIDRAAALHALNMTVNPPTQPQGNGAVSSNAPDEQQFQNNQRLLRLAGKNDIAADNEAKHFPGIPGSASVALTSDDRARIQSGLALGESLKRFRDFTIKNGNSVDPKVINEGKALAAQVQGDFRQATNGGVYKEGEQHFIGKIIPDDPTAFVPSIRILPKLAAVYKETQARTNSFLRSKGMTPSQRSPTTTKPSQGSPTTTNVGNNSKSSSNNTRVLGNTNYYKVQGGWSSTPPSQTAGK